MQVVGFRHVCKVLDQVRSMQLTPHITRPPNFLTRWLGLPACLVLKVLILVRVCYFSTQTVHERRATTWMQVRPLDEFMVGVAVHVTV